MKLEKALCKLPRTPTRGNPCYSFENWAVSVIFQGCFQNKMIGCASKVSEDDLCLGVGFMAFTRATFRKTPNLLYDNGLKPRLYWYILRCQTALLMVQRRSPNVFFMGERVKAKLRLNTIHFQRCNFYFEGYGHFNVSIQFYLFHAGLFTIYLYSVKWQQRSPQALYIEM